MVDAALSAQFEQHGVSPLWSVMANLVTEVPKPNAVAHQWKFEELKDLLLQAGEQISAEEAERRVLILENPGLGGTHRVTESLYAGLQLVLPGEIAPAHRHTQSALRFVLESNGAWTSVDGEKVEMHPFDLVLTPSWRWHEHGGEGGPAIWLDGLDIPIIQHFAAGFAERDGNIPASDSLPAGTCLASYGSNLKPASIATDDQRTPLFHFPYAKWGAALSTFSKANQFDPHLGWAMEFTNPIDGGAVMGTVSAFCHRINAGAKTRPYRQSSSVVYTGVSGTGAIILDGKRFEICPKNLVAAPSWAALEIEADDELTLFSYSDRTCHEKLGFWREERL